jgi:hypothetical protein
VRARNQWLSFEPFSISFLVRKTKPPICIHSETTLSKTCHPFAVGIHFPEKNRPADAGNPDENQQRMSRQKKSSASVWLVRRRFAHKTSFTMSFVLASAPFTD